ncbi:hypothetical protein NEMIN01_1680 [Nematocida minor]|uniref:uncharacterized protein n=1 Tax=Nematocida minor TaxID=1912983 RepID=UPI0022210BE3|nr:uncharacterized protein NEMIN01_1680 [Nematocida minor]KAI5191825.1 hypothetical protein NEMIN01_1680 [Nematocida minor]
MCIRWVYEAIDAEVRVELNAGTVVQGTLRSIDKRENIAVELPNKSTVLISSTAINAIILPELIQAVLSQTALPARDTKSTQDNTPSSSR